MRIAALILLTIIFFNPCFAQIAYYDAQWLSNLDTTVLDEIVTYHQRDSANREVEFEATQASLAIKKTELDILRKTQTDLKESLAIQYSEVDKRHMERVIEKIKVARKDSIRYASATLRPTFISKIELDEVTKLKSFMKNPFDPNLDPIDFEIIYKLFRKLKEVQEGKRGEKYALGLGAITSLLPTVIGAVNLAKGKPESEYIDGLTKYIAEEFKKGVTASYVNIFEKRLDQIGELQIVIPTTYKMLKSRNPFDYPDFGNEWKTTITNDLRDLLPNFLSYVDHPDPLLRTTFLNSDRASKVRNHPAYGYALVATDLVTQVTDKIHPADVLAYLDARYYQSEYPIGKLDRIIHGINILQKNLRDTTKVNSAGSVWIGFEDFSKLNTEKELKYFAGLIYQQDKVFFQSLRKAVWTRNSFDLAKFQVFYRHKIQPIQEILNKIQEFYSHQKDQDDFMVYLKFFVEMLEVVNETYSDPDWLPELSYVASLIDGVEANYLHLRTSREWLNAITDEIGNATLKQRVPRYLDSYNPEEYLRLLKSPEVTKDVAQLEQLLQNISDTEEKIRVLSLPTNCKLSMGELLLVRDATTEAEIIEFIRASNEYNTIPDQMYKILKYQESIRDIKTMFVGNPDLEKIKASVIAKLDKEWVTIMRDALSIYQSVKEKDYGLLVSSTISIIEPMLRKELKPQQMAFLAELEEQIKKIDSMKKDEPSVAYFEEKKKFLEQEAKKINMEIASSRNYQQFVNFFRKYVEFLVAVVNAEDSDEMKEVISTLVAPANSYTKKRVASFFSTITSHPGFYVSNEKLIKTEKGRANIGLTAPIGLEIGVGLTSNNPPETGKAFKKITSGGKERYRSGHSLSLYFQALDVGAVLNYRINDESSDELPSEVTFSQIWSPGVTINWGFKNTPLTLGFGYQRSPKLREILSDDEEGNIGEMSAGNRILLRLSWDIPLVNIYTKAPVN